ncbi:MAG: ABC transporter permease [Acidobacteriia bacterium]|nr:ABC transporter permease [Terriglobia bacterium]
MVSAEIELGGEARARPSKLARFYRDHERPIIGGGTLLSVLLIWELVARSGLVDPLFLSSPIMIAQAGVALFEDGEIWTHLEVSGSEFVLGYALAAAVGIPLGLATGWYRRLSYLLGPFIDTLNAVPRLTLMPIIVIWFGIGIWSKAIVAFLGAVLPILIATHSGVKTNEVRFLQVARSFSASELKIFSSIILPGTVPFIFTGLKYAIGRALLGVVVGELYAATAGLGYMIGSAGDTFQTDVVFFGVLIFTAVGLISVGVLNALERRFETWRPKVGAAS